jgi:hypothetical protein
MTLPEDVDALLDRVGNASEYVSRIVVQRWELWMTALATLRSAGWTSSEMLAACDALNGHWMLEQARRPEFLADELSDAQRLNNVCDKWDVPPKRWTSRVKSLRDSDDMSAALIVLSREYWCGNEACLVAIRRDEREPRSPK